MKKFVNVLVVCDETSTEDLALERAEWLHKANGAFITLIDVIDASPSDFARLFSVLPGRRRDEVTEQVKEAHQFRLAELASQLEARGVPVSTRVEFGTPFIEIIRAVIANDHDLIIKAGARDGGDITSNDMHLLRKAPCPVWMIKGDHAPQTRRILAAVDPEGEARNDNALNRRVLQLATSLARQDNATLDVVSVWHVQEEHTLRHSIVKMPKHEINAIVEREKTASKGRLDKLLAEFRSFDDIMHVHHIKGMPGQVIPSLVADLRIDTLVMGTVGRSGIGGFIIGNTAETILSQVNASLLCVKPPDFQTPVEPTKAAEAA